MSAPTATALRPNPARPVPQPPAAAHPANVRLVQPRLRVLQVDPGLFTAPYDAGLHGGLVAAGLDVAWASRALRPGEAAELPEAARAITCYRRSDGPRRATAGPARTVQRLIKGVEHAFDLRRIARMAATGRFDLVHFQWAMVPRLDIAAMRRIRRTCPVVLTVHDAVPLNGAGGHHLQHSGFDALFGAADHLIVHTEGARASLIARGAPADRVSVIAHGPLALHCVPRPVQKAEGRWRIVLFGRLQSYKGADLLIDALGLLPAEVRDRIEVVIAGEPMIDPAALVARADRLGLAEPGLQVVPRRLDHQAMADLLGSADCFVFPYRAIEASGVLFLVSGLGRWIIASDLGAFGAVIGRDGSRGDLVPPGDAAALADALARSIGRRPAAGARLPGWDAIGRQTAALYRRIIAGPSV